MNIPYPGHRSHSPRLIHRTGVDETAIGDAELQSLIADSQRRAPSSSIRTPRPRTPSRIPVHVSQVSRRNSAANMTIQYAGEASRENSHAELRALHAEAEALIAADPVLSEEEAEALRAAAREAADLLLVMEANLATGSSTPASATLPPPTAISESSTPVSPLPAYTPRIPRRRGSGLSRVENSERQAPMLKRDAPPGYQPPIPVRRSSRGAFEQAQTQNRPSTERTVDELRASVLQALNTEFSTQIPPVATLMPIAPGRAPFPPPEPINFNDTDILEPYPDPTGTSTHVLGRGTSRPNSQRQPLPRTPRRVRTQRINRDLNGPISGPQVDPAPFVTDGSSQVRRQRRRTHDLVGWRNWTRGMPDSEMTRVFEQGRHAFEREVVGEFGGFRAQPQPQPQQLPLLQRPRVNTLRRLVSRLRSSVQRLRERAEEGGEMELRDWMGGAGDRV